MFTIKKNAVVVLFASAFLPSMQAYSQETNFSYTQLSISLVKSSFDEDIYIPATSLSYEVYSDIAGLALSGSYQFANNFIVGASGSYQENSGNKTELNASQSLWFAGYAFPATHSLDVVFAAGLAYSEVEVCINRYGCESADDTGLYLSGGVRGWATYWLELNASISHINFSDFGSETGIGVGVAGWFNDASSVLFNVGFSDETTTASLGYRYSF